MNKDKAALVGIIGLLVITGMFSVLNYRMLFTGSHLAKAQLQFVISADAPWETFPPFMKEYISRKAALDTKLDLKDLKQIRDWYDDRIKKYKDEIVLRIEKDYPEKGGQ